MNNSHLRPTSDLVRVVLEVIPDFSNKGIHMGRMDTLERVFQRLRVIVNQEKAKLDKIVEYFGK